MNAWSCSETLGAIAPALVAALSKLGDVARGRKAVIPGSQGRSGYSYEYADLSDVLADARPVLAQHGIVVMQTASTEGREVEVWTTFVHESGEWMTMRPFRLPAGNTPQNAGSAITYARRYALMSALGVATTDDDGQTAGHRDSGTPRRGQESEQGAGQRAPSTQAPARTEAEAEMRAMLGALAAPKQKLLRAKFTGKFKSNLAGLDPERHVEALEWMRAEVLGETEAAAAADDDDAKWRAEAEADAEKAVAEAEALLREAGLDPETVDAEAGADRDG